MKLDKMNGFNFVFKPILLFDLEHATEEELFFENRGTEINLIDEDELDYTFEIKDELCYIIFPISKRIINDLKSKEKIQFRKEREI